MRNFSFSTQKEVIDLGMKIITARVTDIKNGDSDADFETYKNTELESIKKQWEGKKILGRPRSRWFSRFAYKSWTK